MSQNSMPTNNFYLELLNKHIDELNNIIKNKDEYPEHVYNCILAGTVIQANCILESALLDFHTNNFDNAACEIYKYRQLLVHYSDYRTFDNIEEISKNIIKEFKKAYPNEKEYFHKILKYQSTKENNVLVKKSKNIIYDHFTKSYVFKHEGLSLSVSADKVTVVKDFKRGKVLGYIVNCDSNMNYFSLNENYVPEYYELKAPEDLQNFFIKNFDVERVNTLEYKEMITDMLSHFYSGSFSTLHTYSLPSNPKQKALYGDTAKILNDFFNSRVIYKDFVNNRTYATMGAPEIKYEDYDLIKARVSQDLLNNVSERDYFFIKKTISMFNDLTCEMKKYGATIDEKLNDKMAISMLINFVDHSVKNLSNDFVSSNEEFERLYIRVIDYRNFFAHNIYQLKPQLGERILGEFMDLAKGFTSVLQSLNVQKITNPLDSLDRSFLAIERDSKDFVNSKYEQYVKVDPLTYMGNKLFYSSRDPSDNMLIGLVPNDKHGDLHGAFYDKNENEFALRTYQSKKGNRRKPLLVTKTNFEGGEDVTIDVNLQPLMYINAAYEDKIDDESIKGKLNKSKKKFLIFSGNEYNNNRVHVMSLNTIIMNYYQQRYLPFELARPIHFKLKEDENGKGYFELYDDKDKSIGKVVDEKTYRSLGPVEREPKSVFSITDIKHIYPRKAGK